MQSQSLIATNSQGYKKKDLGVCDHQAMLDFFYSHDGNFIDTYVQSKHLKLDLMTHS
jgi:hypothetical protein